MCLLPWRTNSSSDSEDEDQYFRLRLLYWNINSEQNIHCHPEYQSIGSRVLSGHLIEKIYTPTIYQRSLTSINGITCLNGEDYHDMKALNESVTLNIFTNLRRLF